MFRIVLMLSLVLGLCYGNAFNKGLKQHREVPSASATVEQQGYTDEEEAMMIEKIEKDIRRCEEVSERPFVMQSMYGGSVIGFCGILDVMMVPEEHVHLYFNAWNNVLEEQGDDVISYLGAYLETWAAALVENGPYIPSYNTFENKGFIHRNATPEEFVSKCIDRIDMLYYFANVYRDKSDITTDHYDFCYTIVAERQKSLESFK